MQLSPPSLRFIPLRPKYSLRHPVLKCSLMGCDPMWPNVSEEPISTVRRSITGYSQPCF
jgi:hypothetical protein